MFDITDPDSFHHLNYWLDNIEQSCASKHEKIIVGGKSDLIEHRKVSTEQVAALCEQASLRYVEVSSKTAKNVEQLFETLLDLVLAHQVLDKSRTTNLFRLEGA
jgi:GTPase SAR1 family protein